MEERGQDDPTPVPGFDPEIDRVRESFAREGEDTDEVFDPRSVRRRLTGPGAPREPVVLFAGGGARLRSFERALEASGLSGRYRVVRAPDGEAVLHELLYRDVDLLLLADAPADGPSAASLYVLLAGEGEDAADPGLAARALVPGDDDSERAVTLSILRRVAARLAFVLVAGGPDARARDERTVVLRPDEADGAALLWAVRTLLG